MVEFVNRVNLMSALARKAKTQKPPKQSDAQLVNIQPLVSHNVQPLESHNVQPFVSHNVQPFVSHNIQPLVSHNVQPLVSHRAQVVQCGGQPLKHRTELLAQGSQMWTGRTVNRVRHIVQHLTAWTASASGNNSGDGNNSISGNNNMSGNNNTSGGDGDGGGGNGNNSMSGNNNMSGGNNAVTGNGNSNMSGGTRGLPVAAEDELDVLVRRAEEQRRDEEHERHGIERPRDEEQFERVSYMPYLLVPTFVEESTRAGEENRARRRKRVKILYDVRTVRAQTPAFLDVSLDDPRTPLAFRYIRIILLTAEARRAQDIHLDQHSQRSLSVNYVTQLGVTGRLVIRGALVQSIIYYVAFYDLLIAGKPMPGPVRDYTLKIKVRTHAFLQGTHNLYRVNCIRTNHDLGYYHVVMRVLQN